MVFQAHLRNLAALKTPGQSKGIRLLFAFVSGMLLAGSTFPELHLAWLAWIAPGLILSLVCNSTRRSAFLIGWLAGMGHCLTSFHWLLLIPFPIYGIAGWLALSGWLSLYIALWCCVCRYLLPRPKSSKKSSQASNNFAEIWLALSNGQRVLWPLLCAVTWVAIEMAMGHVLTGFPFISLGAVQFHWLSLIQIASITGVYGVSFLVAWFSVSLMGAIILLCEKQKSFVRPFVQLLPPLAVMGCVIIFGMWKLSAPDDAPTRLKIALVQPSVPEVTIWNPNEETNRFLKLIELSQAALAAKPDLLVWPEAALPEILGRNRYTQETIGNLVRPAGVWMVMGIVDIRQKPNSPGSFDAFNSAFLINPNGDLARLYDKSHLVIFGEYIPRWLNGLSFLKKLRQAANQTPGEHPVPFHMKNPSATFPVSICFEDCFPDEIRRRVDQDTDFILNLTNDGWFGESAVQWQHAGTALFRALENGVPLVRCTNNGLTCWIDARGRLHDIYFGCTKNIYQAGWKMADIPLRSNDSKQHPTFYNQHGDWFGWSCAGILFTAGAIPQFRRMGFVTR